MSEHGRVEYLNPEELPRNPAFTNVVAVSGPVKTVYVAGQNAVTASGEIVGKGDIFQRRWGRRPNPPVITVAMVSALAHPDFLAELEAVSVVPG
jgi:enamine deaminase RidA (YjgF/YER057c/UK114 family)